MTSPIAAALVDLRQANFREEVAARRRVSLARPSAPRRTPNPLVALTGAVALASMGIIATGGHGIAVLVGIIAMGGFPR